MRWIGVGVLVLLVVVGGLAYWQRGPIALAVLERAAARAIGGGAALPDGLHAGFCGTGGPMPDRARAGPCLAVQAGTRLFVFDVGEGAGETLSMMGFQPTAVEAVYLTHLHSDHIDGLAPLALQRWAGSGATAPLPLYGPQGVERVAAGLNEAYAIDSTYRVAHHGADIVPPSGFGFTAHPFAMPEGADRLVLLDDGGVRITAFLVDHAPVEGAVGYRIEYAGRTIVVSGDTRRSAAVVREAQGADLLVHEAISPRISRIMGGVAGASGRGGLEQIFEDILDYHTAPEEAAEVAQEAGAGALALTHIVPPLPLPGLDAAFVGAAASKFDGPVWLMRDGDLVSLPAEGGIERRHVMR